jgi:subtilase family serine protease
MHAFTPLPKGHLTTTPLSILQIFIVLGIYNFEYSCIGGSGKSAKKAFIYQTSGALVLRDTFLR